MSPRYQRRGCPLRHLCMPVVGYTAEDATDCRRRSVGDVSYLLGEWRKREDASSGKLLDRERYK